MNISPGSDNCFGYRLSKVELYNWGTFDGAVHGFHPRGEWTLLVGDNGTGKSTIVDALLTLLVHPRSRKYNFASGALKTERDERTYIQGAYDKTIGPAGTPQLKYLRPGNKHFSALLACFENAGTNQTFTVCQVLYLDSNHKPRKFYALDERHQRGIEEDLGNIKESTSVLTTLKSRGFKTTESYTQYFEWLRRKLGCRPKAMEMFNQAAWVKDVSQLDSFVRDQMLEKRPWDEKVSQLLNNFADLNEAHRALVVVRDQASLLKPIIDTGANYQAAASHLQNAREQLEATSLYFHFATQRVLEPACREWSTRLDVLDGQIDQLDEEIAAANRELARIELEIAGAGGERMQRLPDMAALETERAETKQKLRKRFEGLLTRVSLHRQVDSAEDLSSLLEQVSAAQRQTDTERTEIQQHISEHQYRQRRVGQRLRDEREELDSLTRRTGNLPRELVFLRDQLCRELKIDADELPFAAELMAVKREYREWEASIEQALDGFARSLLVKEPYYSQVSCYLEEHRMVDAAGRGRCLAYTYVNDVSDTDNDDHRPVSTGPAETLLSMLKFRKDHPLTRWVRDHIAVHFDVMACESFRDFQIVDRPAMTRNRHVKHNVSRHSKDDRNQPEDRTQFILGWENREKIDALKSSIEAAKQELAELEGQETRLQHSLNELTSRQGALQQLAEFKDFDAIDAGRHREQASKYKRELKRLQRSKNKVRVLGNQKSELESRLSKERKQYDRLVGERSASRKELENARKLLDRTGAALSEARRDGSFDRLEAQFQPIEERLADKPLTLENLDSLPQQFKQDRYDEVHRLNQELQPLAKSLRSQMLRFLTKFPSFQDEMDDDVDSLPQFMALHERIERDDLPRHEQRFKEKLNEKVLTEVGVLNSHLETEREEIIRKIEEINQALKRMEWNPGTHVRLEPEESKDAEIRDFRRELAGCLSGYMDGTLRADEQTFLKIQKLVDKLRDDQHSRWRDKVIDVRNWFSFSARELVDGTAESRSYYDGGSGKSGGEKARLAFLVLVAAIVYQYDIDPDNPRSDKFRFVMVDEMFSRTASKYANYALELFRQFGLQLLIVAPLDAKARICEPYVGLHAHVVKDAQTDRSEILSYTSQRVLEDRGLLRTEERKAFGPK